MQGIRQTVTHHLRLVYLILFFLTLFLADTPSAAQQNFYDTDLLTSTFHNGRREALRSLMPPNSCAVLFSNPVRNRSNDVDYQYFQDPDFYYLTGLNEPHSVLLIFKDPVKVAGKETKEVIFIQNRNLVDESWDGKRLGIEGVVNILGFHSVFLNKEFSQYFPDITAFEKILVQFPTDISVADRNKSNLNGMVTFLKEELKAKNKSYEVSPLVKALTSLREIKLPEELVLMQKAIDMTNAGFEEVIRAVKPGMTEYQAQAIMEYYFKHHGSEYPGYGSISGSGENSCVLHYVTNRKLLKENDLLLMDMGAEYHGYTADITRTIPVDGTFSNEQKLIYEIVLDAQLKGIASSRMDNMFSDPHLAATAVISEGLIKLGIITNASQVDQYFNHGTSHYLGMEVHDPGSYGKLKPGMIITVEPGIYIPEGSPCDKKWWNIGVRIEDNILITDNEPVVMSGKLVKSISGIEKLMQESSLFDQVK